MRKLLLCLLSLTFAAPAFAADRYEFDKSHTAILFFIDHLGYSKTVGKFTEYDGVITFDEKKADTSSIDVTLKPASIRTSSEALDKHLQNADFFNTEKFPDIRFVSKSIKTTGEKTGEVMGEVTMLGVTKPVTLKVTLNKTGVHPKTQDTIAGFSAEATVKRSEFGMNYGIPMVGDDVRIVIETELVNMDKKLRIKEQEKPEAN